MRPFLKEVIIPVLSLCFLFGCSSDDDGSDEVEGALEQYYLQAIIGSWSYDTVTINGEQFVYEHSQGCERDLFQFYNEEGKEFEFEELAIIPCSNCAPCASTQTGLEWELENDRVDLYFGEDLVVSLKLLEVTEEFLSYQRQFDINGDGEQDSVIITATYYDPFGDFSD